MEQLLAHVDLPERVGERAAPSPTPAQVDWMLLCVQRHLARGPIAMIDNPARVLRAKPWENYEPCTLEIKS